MIVTVTLNPTLDKTLSVARLQPGKFHRAKLLREDLGGKGINVSRALRSVGIKSKIVCCIGGRTGQAMKNGLLAAGFEGFFMEVEGETRQNITLYDETTRQYTKINEPGSTLHPDHIRQLEAYIRQTVRPGDLWAFCGRLPPGAAVDLYARLIRQVQARGGQAVLDTSGQALQEGVAARPFAVKPNSHEAAELLGLSLHTTAGHYRAARQLQGMGVPVVVLSRGADGLVLAMGRDIVWAKPPPVAVRSAVGAGDAALAGLLWAVSNGCEAAETARRAVACGTAAAMQEGTGLGDRPLVDSLLGQVQIIQYRESPNV